METFTTLGAMLLVIVSAILLVYFISKGIYLMREKTINKIEDGTRTDSRYNKHD